MNPLEYQRDDPRVMQRLNQLRYDTNRDWVKENNDVAKGMGLSVQGILVGGRTFAPVTVSRCHGATVSHCHDASEPGFVLRSCSH
jgi:hypothetical protein